MKGGAVRRRPVFPRPRRPVTFFCVTISAEETDGIPDGEVVRRVRSGETELYGVLVRRYGDRLFRHAEGMTGRPDVAADLVQAAFVKGFGSLGGCDPRRVGGWLFRILSNLAHDHLRDPREAGISLDALPPARDPAGGPDVDLERRELGRCLERALDRLTPEQREAFVLKHYEGYSYEEMSELLGAAPAALKMRVHRARDALRIHLEGIV